MRISDHPADTLNGETRLVEEVLAAMGAGPVRILNVGAGRSPWVEYQLDLVRKDFVSDRVDIDDPTVDASHSSYAHVGQCWTAAAEHMPEVPSGAYGIAFSNYVLEHVHDLDAAAREIRRVLQPAGIVVISVPNPSAPHMRLSAITPLAVHKALRREESWPTAYRFRTPEELAQIFERNGFRCLLVERISNVSGYLQRWSRAAHRVGLLYDSVVTGLGLRGLMGDACLVCQALPRGTKT